MSKIVRKSLSDCKLTAKQKRDLTNLAKRPDSEIDLSDIPELTDDFWKNAQPNPFYKPVKKQISLRIDADVLEWLRQNGKEGYQVRLNAVLRSAMLQDLRTKKKRA